MAHATALWMREVGALPHGRIGAALKPLVKAYGYIRVWLALKEYLATTTERKKIEYFAQEFQRWERSANEPLVDDYGDLTPKGVAIWNDINRGARGR